MDSCTRRGSFRHGIEGLKWIALSYGWVSLVILFLLLSPIRDRKLVQNDIVPMAKGVSRHMRSCKVIGLYHLLLVSSQIDLELNLVDSKAINV